MPEVLAVKTPIDEANAVKAITKKLLPSVSLSTQEAAQLFLAQIWLETTRGSSIYNNNWGNITAGKSWTGDFWRPPWFDKTKVDALPDSEQKTRLLSLHQRMLEGKAPQKFRAYGDLVQGLQDYINRLNHEFHALVDAAKTGSPRAFAEAIKSSGYTPDANVIQMTGSLTSLMHEFTKKGLFSSLPKASAPVPVSSPVSPSSGQPELSSTEPSASSQVVSGPHHDRVPSSGELPWIVLGSVGSAVELFRFLVIGGTGVITDDDDEAIRDYQTATNVLRRDGEVGPLTWAHVLDAHGLRRKV